MVAFCICLGVAHAQELPANTSQQLENLAALSDDEPDETVLFQLNHWLAHPLDLNTVGAEELKLFPFLSALHVGQFIRYRQQAGRLVDVHELQAVPGWDLATIRELLPYVTVHNRENADTWKSLLREGEHLLQLRWSRTLQKARGYQRLDGSRFAGDANALLLRYQYRHSQGLQYGLVADKDAGEALLQKGRATPDFYAFHVFKRGRGLVRSLALGDYTVNIGQGLVHWQALAFGKSPEVMAIKRQGPVLRPYASAGEFHFLRGAGITLGKGPWEATFFAARQRIHANTGRNEQGTAILSSFVPSGLHRTASEYDNRKAVGQWTAGGAVQYRKGGFQSGFHGVAYRFDLPVERRAEPYNLYGPRGTSFYNFGIDYSFTYRNLHLFGEGAIDRQRKGALVSGALLSLHPAVDLSLLGRWIHKGYTAIAANAFTESSTATNEQGMYMGLQWRPFNRLRVSAYADLFRWPWLRFRVAAPGSGADYLLQLQYRPSRTAEAYLLLRSETRPAKFPGPDAVLHAVMTRQRNLVRMQWSQALDERWQLRFRAEGGRVAHPLQGNPQFGTLFFADGRYRWQKGAAIDARLSWFTTDDAVRIYAYEQDVLFGYSIPGWSGRGMRGYATVRVPWGRYCTFWLRVAHTRYHDREAIGTGPAAIGGNQRTDVRIQTVFRW